MTAECEKDLSEEVAKGQLHQGIAPPKNQQLHGQETPNPKPLIHPSPWWPRLLNCANHEFQA